MKTTVTRTVEDLTRSAMAVLDDALALSAVSSAAPLFSGGHDSLCAVHLASCHPSFRGDVYHIDTGIGARRTREFVEATCLDMGWKLVVLKSPSTYETFVRERGFPGPAMHQWAYIRLKERCVRQIVRELGLRKRHRKVILITGCRREESTRRMGTVERIKVGERKTIRKNRLFPEEVTVGLNRVWAAPCFDWTAAEQVVYMDEHDLPRNPLKIVLGMSGECFCGAFARPNEIELVRRHVPDVAAEIDRLTKVAIGCGKHAVWGTRPPKEKKGIAVVQTGPLCTSCDRKAAAAGIVFDCNTDTK